MRLGLTGGKGGGSKSTLAINLAHALAEDGSRVLLLDADPQHTVGSWLEERGRGAPFDVAPTDGAFRVAEFDEWVKDYDHVVTDGPPRAADIMRAILITSSHVLLPIQPSGPDLWGQLPVLKLLRDPEAQRHLPVGQKVAFILARVVPGTVIGRDFAQMVQPYGLPVLDGTTHKIGYVNAITRGLTVFEDDPRGAPAREVRALLQAIKEL